MKCLCVIWKGVVMVRNPRNNLPVLLFLSAPRSLSSALFSPVFSNKIQPCSAKRSDNTLCYLPSTKQKTVTHFWTQWGIKQLKSQIFLVLMAVEQNRTKRGFEYWTFIHQVARNTNSNECSVDSNFSYFLLDSSIYSSTIVYIYYRLSSLTLLLFLCYFQSLYTSCHHLYIVLIASTPTISFTPLWAAVSSMTT